MASNVVQFPIEELFSEWEKKFPLIFESSQIKIVAVPAFVDEKQKTRIVGKFKFRLRVADGDCSLTVTEKVKLLILILSEAQKEGFRYLYSFNLLPTLFDPITFEASRGVVIRGVK